MNLTPGEIRAIDGQQYVKHMLRLAPQADQVLRVGDVFPEIVLTNSHNRTSSFGLEAGLFRYLCSNGLMACTAQFAGVRVLHNDPDIHQHVIEGVRTVQQVIDTVAVPMVEKMTKVVLPKPLQLEFATAATMLKFGDEKPEHAVAFLEARRDEDEGDDLWHVLNRVQENAVRGGYAAKDRTGRNITARGIASVDRDRQFNTDLWLLGAKVAEMVA